LTWEFKKDRPIYAQLIEQIELNIISGLWGPGERLPSVRDLAAQAAVNPNTMQRALSELERDGLLYTVRTSGRFITEDGDMIQKLKDSLAMVEIREFFEKMSKLGFDRSQTIRMLENAARGEK